VISSLRRLAIQFSHFFSGSFLGMLLGLVTFPILTRQLSQADYGMLGIVTTTVSLAVVAAKGGLSDGIVRFYPEYAQTEDERSVFASTVVMRGLALASIVTVAYLLLLPLIERGIGADASYHSVFLVMALYLWARPLNIIVYNYLRALGRTLAYNVISLTQRLATVGLSLVLLIYVLGDLHGYFLGTAVAEASFALCMFGWLLARYRVRPSAASGALAWKLIRFGVPLLATELLYLLLRSGDRYLVQAFLGESALGVYAVGYTLPGYINDLVMFSISYAIVPIYVDVFGREGAAATSAFLNRALRYYLMAAVVLVCGYSAVATDIIVVLASEKYRAAGEFSPLILAGLVFLGATTLLNAGLYLLKRTVQLLLVMLASVVVNIVTNLLLLPQLGVAGGAWATLAAGVTAALLTAVLSFRHLPLQVDWRVAILYTLLLGLPLLALHWFDTGHPLLNLVLKLPTGAAWVGAVVLWREPELRSVALRQLKRLRHQ
jgi:O-antigen/teichoic acid export membrane protein